MLALDTNFYFAAAGLRVNSGAWFFGPYHFLAVLALFTHLGCALSWHMKRLSPNVRRNVIGGAVLVGTAASGSIIAALTGMTEPADSPAAYKARYGAADKLDPAPAFSLIQAEPIDARDDKRGPRFESHRREGP